MKHFLLFTFIVLSIISCNKDQKKTPLSDQTIIVKLDSLSTQKADTSLLKLSPDAKKDLVGAKEFQILHKKIQQIAIANPFSIKKEVDSVHKALLAFEEHLRPEHDTNPIRTRIVILTTEIGLFKEILDTPNLSPEKVLKHNNRLITAYNSFIIQLNEISLAIPENIENELLKDSEDYRDSIP